MSRAVSETARPSGPNCYQCRHFAVSWDPALPYACRLMGFKSRALPALEVLRVDGVRCRGFQTRDDAAHSPSIASASLASLGPRSPAPMPMAQPPLGALPAADLVPDPIPDLRQLRRLSAFRRSA